MEEKAQYTDLLYFGYDYIGEEGEESKKFQSDFIFAYLIAHGWYEFTLEMLKLSSAEDSESKKLFMYYIDKAKEQYPNNFKQQQ
jgi:hypothetical protein